jgi:hypothetical protein
MDVNRTRMSVPPVRPWILASPALAMSGVPTWVWRAAAICRTVARHGGRGMVEWS